MTDLAGRFDSPATDRVLVSVKEFLVTEQRCPPEWRPLCVTFFRERHLLFLLGQFSALCLLYLLLLFSPDSHVETVGGR